MSAREVVLASGSASRARLLAGAGVPFRAVSPGVDEEAVKVALLAENTSPRDVADALAELKAMRVSARGPELVIGADQTLEFERRLYSKPHDLAEARAVLLRLRGATHALHNAVAVAVDGGIVWREVTTVKLTMRAFSEAWLDDYLEREAATARDSPGSYRIEGLGAQLFTRIDGDLFGVMGLPLLGLLDCLRRYGVCPT